MNNALLYVELTKQLSRQRIDDAEARRIAQRTRRRRPRRRLTRWRPALPALPGRASPHPAPSTPLGCTT